MQLEQTVSKGKILLIEDDPDHSLLLKNWLSSDSPFEVTVVNDGHLGHRLVEEGGWDMVLSDIRLPGSDGFEVLTHSKETNPLVPVCLLTAQQEMNLAIEALQKHADDLFLKPMNREDLLSKVFKHILESQEKIKAKQKTILAIGAHPDDVEIGCGGALLFHRAQGHQVVVLTLSDGSQGGYSEERRSESQQASEILKAKLLWGDLQDTHISDSTETISVIEEAINQYQPKMVYTHTESDIHQDHRNTSKASKVAARAVPSVYCYQAPSTTIDFKPSTFVDIESQMDKKLGLISSYTSQTQKRSYLAEDMIRATARYWGRFANYKSVEAFEVIRDRHDFDSKNTH